MSSSNGSKETGPDETSSLSEKQSADDTEIVHGRNKIGIVVLAIGALLGVTYLISPDLVSKIFTAVWKFIY